MTHTLSSPKVRSLISVVAIPKTSEPAANWVKPFLKDHPALHISPLQIPVLPGFLSSKDLPRKESSKEPGRTPHAQELLILPQPLPTAHSRDMRLPRCIKGRMLPTPPHPQSDVLTLHSSCPAASLPLRLNQWGSEMGISPGPEPRWGR